MFKRLGPLRPIPLPPDPEKKYVLDEHEKIQKNTYTRWVNYHLETHSSSGQIRDLFEDLKDGVYLCHLIEVLTGEALPVNKARVSKRVHHVSNLTTALGVLRRRGLELINNNPTDIADGNPRIILGLIWQMILHFQIETNLHILREWGYEGGVQHSTAASTSHSPSTSAQSTPKKAGSSLFPSVLHKHKTTVDRILLEWIQREIGQKYGLQINDMDRSWRDGLAFMALVHRSNPALVDMEVAKRRTPRENIETAFELARVHLNIRPLLEVDDVLHEKPDKRSIVTYVSQFLRAPTSGYAIHAPEKIADRYVALIDWIKATAAEPKVKIFIHDKLNLPKDYFADHEWFTRRRREFLERRVLFTQLRDESHHLAPEDWTKVLSEWKSISELLREWSHRLENDLPEPLMNLAQWLSSGEQLVHSPMDVSRDKARHSLWALDAMLDNLEKHFKALPVQRQKLERSIADNRIPSELLNPLRVRLDALSEEYKIRRETLLLLRAHYRILVFVEELGKKLDIWRGAESLAALQQWLVEYNKEAEKVPENQLRSLLAEMREAIPEQPEESRTEGEQSFAEANSAAEDVAARFRDMRKYLEELLGLWQQFESDASKMETYLVRYEREQRAIDDEIRFLLTQLEAVADRLSKSSSTTARGSINARLGSYRRRLHDLSRPVGGRLVVNIHPATSSTPSLASPQPLSSNLEDVASIAAIKGSRLEQWLTSLSQLLRRRAKSAHGASKLCEKLNEYQKQIVEMEEERLRLTKRLSNEEKDRLTDYYKKIRLALPLRLDALRGVQPLLSDVEKRLREVELYIQQGEASELGRLPIRERAEYLEQAGYLIDSLEEKHAEVVSPGQLRLSFTSLRSGFTFPSSSDATDSLAPGPSTSVRRVTSLRDRFEPPSPSLRSKSPTYVDRIADLLERKRRILDRREDSAAGAKASILEMEMVNEALILHNATEHPQFQPMEREWQVKISQMERLIAIDGELDKLAQRLRVSDKPSEFAFIEGDIEVLARKFSDLTLDLPLLTICQRKVSSLRRNVVEQKNLQCKRVFDRFEVRLRELEMTPEEDLAIAEIIIKGIVEEAAELERLYPEEPRRLLKHAKSVQKSIETKMEFFGRLQRFYEAIKTIHQEQAQWRVITSSQIDEVRKGIDLRLRQIDTEHRPEADTIEVELRGIEAQFFQLECDRIKEKFRLLVAQLEKARRLMLERQLFLGYLQDFRETIEKTIELSDQARALPLEADETGERLKQISNDLNDLQDKARTQSDRISDQQRRAEMTVTDFEHSVTKLNEAARAPALIGIEPESQVSERVDALNRELVPLLATSIYPFEPRRTTTTTPHEEKEQQPISSQATVYILNSMDSSSKEKTIIDEIARCLDRLPTSSTSQAPQRLEQQRQEHAERNRRRYDHVHGAVDESVAALRTEIKRLEALIDEGITDRNIDAVTKLDHGEWKLTKQTISDLQRSLDLPQLKLIRDNWQSAFRDLDSSVFNIDAKVMKFNRRMEREQRLLRNLAAFAEWIDLVEKELVQIEARADLEPLERQEQLQRLKENCEKHQRLVSKLELHKFQSDQQLNFAKEQTTKYRDILDRLNRMNLPPLKDRPIEVRTDLPSTSLEAQSQLSIASTSSFGSHPEKDGGEDLESDLASVHSEVIRTEAERIVLSPSALATPQKEAELLRMFASNPNEPRIMDDIRQAVATICEQLRGIRDFYEMLPLKNVERAEHDVPQLQELISHAATSSKHLSSITHAARKSPAEHTLLQSLEDDLRGEITAANNLVESLESEIQDERQLQLNYRQIMIDLNKIEEDVRAAAEKGVKPRVKDDLRTIELEMDVLRRLCKKPRRYVASSIDGSPLSTPTRRRRIVLKITNSVLTIIKVVEEQLSRALPSTARRQIAGAQDLNPALQGIYDNLRLIQRKMEEDSSPPISALPSFDYSEEPVDVPKLIEQAEDIKRNLEKLSSVEEVLEEPEQYALLIKASREGRSGLEQILTKIDETPEPTEPVQEYRNRVVDLVQSLLNLEDQLSTKHDQSKAIHEKCRTTYGKATDAKAAADEILKEINPSTESLLHAKDNITNILRDIAALNAPILTTELSSDIKTSQMELEALLASIDNKLKENEALQKLVEQAKEIVAEWHTLVKELEDNANYDLENGKKWHHRIKEANSRINQAENLQAKIQAISPADTVIQDIEIAKQAIINTEKVLSAEIKEEENHQANIEDLFKTLHEMEQNENELPTLEVMKSTAQTAIDNSYQRKYICSNITQLKQLAEETESVSQAIFADIQTSAINEAKQKLTNLEKQPDITEESFVKIHQQLSQLPENDPMVIQLHQQLEEVQAKTEAKNSLKRKLNDNVMAKIDELKNIQQNVIAVDESIPESSKKRSKKSKISKEPQIIGNTRDEQISNLKIAIDNIENNVTPTLSELARKASDNGIDIPQLQIEEQNANDLLQNLKNQLAKKEQEHENVQKAQQDVQNLTSFIDEVNVAQPIITDSSNLNADNAQSSLNDLTKHANDLKQYLDRIDEIPEDAYNAFTDEERQKHDRSRDNANELLKQLLEKCNDLQKQLDNISEWNKKKSELDDQTNDIIDAVDALKNEFNTHQSLATAKDGVRRAEALEPRLKEAQKQLKKTHDWLQKQLPNNDEVKQQLDELHNKLDDLKKTREDLINHLEQDIERENKLIADQNALIDNINKLGEDAIAVHKLDDLDKKPAALAAIHDQVKPLEDKLQQLENRIHDPNTIIDHSDTLNIPLIRQRLHDITQSLNEQEKDAADKLALAGISSKLNRDLSILREAIDKAERIDNDSDATVNDLQKVKEILESNLPIITEIENLLQNLDITNPDANNLKNQTIEDLSQLRQRLDATHQSADDRANNLQQFNNDLDNIAQQFDDILKALNDLKPDDPQTNVDQVNALKQQNELNGNILKAKNNDLANLLPLNQPNTRYNYLLQRQQDLDHQLQKILDNVINETAKRQEIQTFNDQLNKADDDLVNAERILNETPSQDILILEQINEEHLIPINELIKNIDILPIPNDEIKNRKKAIKKRLQLLNDKHAKKLENAQKQHDIIQAIENNLKNLEIDAENILPKYSNVDIKIPLIDAIEDSKALQNIIEQLSPLNIDEIDDKLTRDALSKRVEQLRSQVKSLIIPLNEDINVEEKLLQDYNNLLTKLNDIGINILALGETGIIDDEIKKAGDLIEQLRKLAKPAKTIDSKIEKSLNYIKHSIDNAPLTPKIDELQNNLEEKRKALENRAKLDTIVPAIDHITIALQQKANELEKALPENLEQQQQAFNELADQKRKLEDLIEKIPEGSNGDEIREKSQWDLSRFTNLLKKLGDAVGEKAAALAAFIASKRAIDDQLNTLNNDINAAESNLDNATPNNLQDRINILEAEEARIIAIRSKLSDEQQHRDHLDNDKQKELDELHKALDAAVERLQNAKNNLTQQLASTIASEQLQADTNHYYNDLADLIRQAHQTLADPTAIPITYHDLAQRINDKVKDTNQVIENANISENSNIIQPLIELLPQAQTAENDLNTRYNLWLEFVHERDNANDQVDQARNVLTDFEANRDLRPINVAEEQLEKLKASNTSFNAHHSTLLKLQELSEQLDPCENAYADVRFIETDWEQTNEDFEMHLTNLHNEISEENGITDGINKVITEIDHLFNDIPSLANESLIDIKDKAIPPLQTEINRLSKLDSDSHRNRRFVERNTIPSINDIKDRLNQLENATQQRINDIEKLENQKRIDETRKQLDIITIQPDITEESFVKIHQQLSQLPENDPMVIQLHQQLEEVQAKTEAKNSLKRKLNDNVMAKIDELKNIQQNVIAVDESIPESSKKRSKKSKISKEPQIIGNTRDEQISNLKIAIDNIENNVTPTLSELARKASDNGIDIPQLQIEEQNANDLLQNLKNQLAKKEQEHENVQKAQQDVQNLTSFIDEVNVAQPIITDSSNLNADNAQSSLNDLTKHANDLKQYLDRIDEIPEDAYNAFTDEERQKHDRSRDNANELLKQLLEKCNDLQKQLDNISEWNKKKSELDDQTNDIIDAVDALKNEFNTHQSLATAKDGVRRAEALEPRLKEAQKQLKKTHDWLQKQLPNNDEVKQQLDELHNKLDDLKKTREDLINHLEQDIERENKLIADQNALIDNINKLGEDAIAVHKLDDLDKKPAALAAIHDQVKPLEDKLQQLENRIHDPNTIIDHSDTLNIPLIRQRLHDITQSLNEQEKDAADKLALAGISSKLNRDLSILREAIDKAERIDNDSDATVNDLQKVKEILESNLPIITEIENLLQNLDITNPDANNLKNQTIEDLSQLRQRLDATHQSADDRANNLQQFNNDLDNIAQQFDDILKALNDLKPDDPQTNVDQVNALKQQNELNGNILKAKNNDLANLLPLNQPNTRYNYLLQRQQDLDHQLQKILDNVINETAKRQEIQTFNDQLNKADDDLVNAERILNETPSQDILILEQINEEHLIPINELIKNIDILPIPNDEIKNRKKAIKKRLQLLNDKHAKKLENAQKQHDIIQAIENNLKNLEIDAENILPKYSNVDIKIPLIDAIEDSKALQNIIEQLSPLNIDEIDDKLTRDALSKRVEQLRSQVKSLIIPLNEDINVEEKLLQDYNNLLTKLNDIGINILALGETGIIDDEIKKAGDLIEQLRKLAKPAKTIDSKIEKSLNYIKHSIDNAPLTPKIDELQNNLEEKRKALENRAKLDTIVPAIDHITIALQQKANELEKALPENLEQQQQAFNELADQKRKLEDLIEKIPEGSNGDEIREKSQWDLSRFTNLLKKLGDAVGEKAAALAAFIASKRAIDDQLNTLNNDINAAESNLDNATPNNLQDRINILEAEEARIIAIRSKLSDEQQHRDHLDNDKQKELDELHKALDAAVERLQNAKNNLTQQLASTIASEQLQADTNHYYNDLADLIRQAHQTLADPTAIPITYHDLAQRINDKVKDTNQVIENANISENSNIIQPLIELLPQAQTAENDLNTRYNLWLEFVHERDNANDQVDQARNVLTDFEANRDLRPINVAEEQLEKLKHGLEVIQGNHALLQATEIGNKLLPMESAGGEIRFLHVDVEELEEELESILSSLSTEISQEKGLNAASEYIKETLQTMLDRVNGVIESENVDDLDPLLQDLDSLKASVISLKDNLVEMKKSRKYVLVGEYPIVDNLDGPLDEIEEKIRTAVQTVHLPELEIQLNDQPYPDLEALAGIIAKAYPDADPRDVLRDHGYENLIPEDYHSDVSSRSDFGNADAESQPSTSRSTDDDLLLSPLPENLALDNPEARAHYLRQRSRWRRILRTALPLQAMLVLLLGAACLVPHCDDEYCCQLLNNFARSFDPTLDFPNGPPPF